LALNGGRKLTLDEYALICGVLGVSSFITSFISSVTVIVFSDSISITPLFDQAALALRICLQLVDLLKKANSLSNELAEKLKSLKINIEV